MTTQLKGDSSVRSANSATPQGGSSNRDGGPAFPQNPPNVSPGTYGYYIAASGMSLRDYFAAAAISSGDCPHNVYLIESRAQWAYEQADAMLAERDK